MKSQIHVLLLSALCAFLFACGCRRDADERKRLVIVLQPLGGYDDKRIDFLKRELQQFYGKKVIVWPDRPMPASFIDRSKGERYSGPKIIRWLSGQRADTVIAVVGLTSKDIYTTKKNPDGSTKKPESKYAVWGIFGLGYCPGGACVMSDNRLKTADLQQFRHRLRTVVIHEIGHNLGLPHCPNAGCIMSDANEVISTVDNSGNDYCSSCKEKAGI